MTAPNPIDIAVLLEGAALIVGACRLNSEDLPDAVLEAVRHHDRDEYLQAARQAREQQQERTMTAPNPIDIAALLEKATDWIDPDRPGGFEQRETMFKAARQVREQQKEHKFTRTRQLGSDPCLRCGIQYVDQLTRTCK